MNCRWLQVEMQAIAADGEPLRKIISMLLKLYRKDKTKTLYWEAWPDGEEIVIHFGELGDTGETTAVALPEFEPPETAIQKHAEEARQAGFEEIGEEDLFELIVQYKKTAVESEKFQLAEEIINDCLGWTGLGHSDGMDDSGSAVNIYCYVVEPEVAARKLVDELSGHDLLDHAVIAFQDRDENFVVVWPEGFRGVFEY